VAIAAVTTACVVAFGVLEALIVAVGLSMIDTVRRSATPHDAVLGHVARLGRYGNVAVHRSATVTPGVVVYRLDDRLFFANARYFTARVHEAIRAAPDQTSWLVFDAEAVTHVDTTGLDALDALTKDLRRGGVTLVVARMRSWVKEQLDIAGVTETIGSQHFYATIHEAVDACVRARDGT
jgi:MFS superfamily sulfate permease-like transporter